jgi:DNA polymerase III subunit delta
MKITGDQLLPQLERSLKPAYLVSGDEILFMQEAVVAIKAKAQADGFTERLSFTVDAGFDWSQFQAQAQTGSLFSDKQCLELRLVSTKLNESGKKILENYLARPPAGKLLLMVTGKLDAATQRTTWVKNVEQVGVMVTIWPLQPAKLAPFLQRRLQQSGLKTDSAGIELLVARTQGNLLAAAQEIEKLSLLYPLGTTLTVRQIHEASADNSRFNVFDLTDHILQANLPNIVRILAGLRAEGVEPTLILWALTRELRQLIPLAQAREIGKSWEQILSGPSIWEKRKPWIRRLLEQHTPMSLQQCLQKAAKIDAIIKGGLAGSVWDELMGLALGMATKYIAL